jgi:hypothetical protein
MPPIPLDVLRATRKKLRYRFVAPDFESERPFAIERDVEVIDMCASRLAADARMADQLAEPAKPGDDPRDATMTHVRTMMIYDEIPEGV